MARRRSSALIVILALTAGTASAAAGRFRYPAGAAWKLEETTLMPGMDPAAGMPPASVAVLAYAVVKTFPDGSALVSSTPLSCRRGPSATALADAPLPNGGKPGWFLYARDGRIYMVQPKMPAGSPAEQEMMDAGGNEDEVALLQASATTTKYLTVMRNKSPLDQLHVPGRPLKPGAKAKMDAYAVTRLPDEAVGGAACEVYRAVMEPMVETCWLDPKAGRLVRRTVVQGDPAQVSITQQLVP